MTFTLKGPAPTAPPCLHQMIEPLLLTTARVSTFFGQQPLTVASGFFFQREERVYLITNRHVLIDTATGHLPDRIEIEMHTDAANLARSSALSVWLYRDGKAIWYQGSDGAGDIDVAAIPLDPQACPPPTAGAPLRRRTCFATWKRCRWAPRC